MAHPGPSARDWRRKRIEETLSTPPVPARTFHTRSIRAGEHLDGLADRHNRWRLGGLREWARALHSGLRDL